MRIEDIDQNFCAVETGGKVLNFFNALKSPFVVSGFPWHDGSGRLSRLPERILPLVNEGVRSLTYHTSGGMIRFKTTAPDIVLRTDLAGLCDMSHMPRNGSAGFDLYLGSGKNKKYFKSAMPALGDERLDVVLAGDLPAGEMREWTLYMPLYSGVSRVEIGLTPGSEIAAPTPFAYSRPILFYGSSITQGGCASRTGNAYTSLLSRWFDANLINLGFSGSGKGEPVIAETIAQLELSAFVFDYDHNATSPEHLQETHEPFFKIIRSLRPELPVIMLSKCDYCDNQDTNQRRNIIRRTYDNAVNNGDKNVWFIDGETLFAGPDRDSCTVDGCHPNDLGFYRMATTIYPVLNAALKSLPQ